MGVGVQGWNKESMACGDKAGLVAAVDVPMVTLVKDGSYDDGTIPFESDEEEVTQIWMIKLEEFGFLDGF